MGGGGGQKRRGGGGREADEVGANENIEKTFQPQLTQVRSRECHFIISLPITTLPLNSMSAFVISASNNDKAKKTRLGGITAHGGFEIVGANEFF